ncbi:MAG: ABC transporter permease [Armatimonadetes bacterium]|nr:ABC transporter permease [Armatimonadota bacterium]
MIVFVTVAAGADRLAPYHYDAQLLSDRLKPPAWTPGGSWAHPLGSDQLGRDILSRILYGARVSLAVGLLSVTVGCAAGTTLGLVAGYAGGAIDAVVSRAADAQLSFPYLLLAVALMALGGRGLFNLILVLSLGSWVVYARTVRAAVMSLKTAEFIEAARAVGAPTWRIMIRHILPNTMAPLTVISSFQFAQMLLSEASLSFLGLGVQPPAPSWGEMLGSGRSYLTSAWWLATLPGLSIALVVLGANLVGDGLRDVFDPRVVAD